MHRHNIICDLNTCIECRSRHGQIYGIDEVVDLVPPLHNNCRCDIIPMESIESGNATKNNNDGADYWLKHFGELPEYYLTKEELIQYGWSDGKKPAKFAPEKMYSKGVYNNVDGHLPDALGRTWYEANINYYEGEETDTEYYGQMMD